MYRLKPNITLVPETRYINVSLGLTTSEVVEHRHGRTRVV